MEGHIPHNKRPGKEVPALWRGSLVGKGVSRTMNPEDVPFEEDYKLKSGRKRIPDDTKARPSTLEG